MKDDTVESGICESMTGYKKKYHVEIIPPTCQIHFILEATENISFFLKNSRLTICVYFGNLDRTEKNDSHQNLKKLERKS